MIKNFSSSHFKHVVDKIVDGKQLSAYYVKGATMVLMSSVTFEPLAAITIESTDSECMAAVSERQSNSESNKQRFHSIFNKDNTTFTFTITNLCFEGNIAFNIMLSDALVTQTEPPEGICTVNELKPLQSYTIESNQHSDHATLMLSTIKNTSVRSDEAKSAALQQGLRFFLKVLPQANKPAFEKTQWISPDFIVLKTPTREAENNGYGSDYDDDGGDVFDDDGGGIFEVDEDDEDGNEFCSNRCILESACEDVPPVEEQYQSEASPSNTQRHEVLNSSQKVTKSLSAVLPEDLILNSNAAKLMAGSRQVKHSGHYSGITYDYLRVSECSLSFSIETKMKISNEHNLDITELSQSAIESSIGAEQSAFMSKPKFQSDVCCICMDEDVGKPDATYFSCGHIAVHKTCNKNLTKCPLCRQIVRAVL